MNTENKISEQFLNVNSLFNNDEFIVKSGNRVYMRFKASSSNKDDPAISKESFYQLILLDIIKIMDFYPSKYGSIKKYYLCPRWKISSETIKNTKREVYVSAIHPEFKIKSGTPLGKIVLTHNEEEDKYFYDDKHIFEKYFSLDFIPEPNKRFISAEEFYELYHLLNK